MQKHLESGVYDVVCAHDSAPEESDLRRVARELGCELPDEFVVHATNSHGGLYVEVKEELWPRAKAGDVGPFWTFLTGLYTYNIADGIPEFMDLRLSAVEFQEETSFTAIPFLKIIGDADVYCFTTGGQIVRWDHELNELTPQNRSFFDLLDFELGDLAERKDRKLAEQDQ